MKQMTAGKHSVMHDVSIRRGLTVIAKMVIVHFTQGGE